MSGAVSDGMTPDKEPPKQGERAWKIFLAVGVLFMALGFYFARYGPRDIGVAFAIIAMVCCISSLHAKQ